MRTFTTYDRSAAIGAVLAARQRGAAAWQSMDRHGCYTVVVLEAA